MVRFSAKRRRNTARKMRNNDPSILFFKINIPSQLKQKDTPLKKDKPTKF
jgi:hypothetical protein